MKVSFIEALRIKSSLSYLPDQLPGEYNGWLLKYGPKNSSWPKLRSVSLIGYHIRAKYETLCVFKKLYTPKRVRIKRYVFITQH